MVLRNTVLHNTTNQTWKVKVFNPLNPWQGWTTLGPGKKDNFWRVWASYSVYVPDQFHPGREQEIGKIMAGTDYDLGPPAGYDGLLVECKH